MSVPERGTHTTFKRAVLAADLKFPADHWQRVTGVVVLDADGWSRICEDQSNWDEPITRSEFLCRAAESTSIYPRNFFESRVTKV